jgi:hypothetical protein
MECQNMEELTREDQAILLALEQASAVEGSTTANQLGLDPVSQGMVREYTELWGLLAYELEPQKPKLSTKVRILGAVTGQGPMPTPLSFSDTAPASASDRSFDEMTLRSSVVPQEPVQQQPTQREAIPRLSALPTPTSQPQQSAQQFTQQSTQQSTQQDTPEPAEMTLRHSNVVGNPQAFQPVPTRRTTNYSNWALAAMLGVCLLGLGYSAGQLKARDATITRLQAVASTMPLQSAEMGNLRDELATLKRRFHMVTRVARAAYPMRTMGSEGTRDEVGKIYVCGAHQRWYLNLETLAQPPEGKKYHLWFMTAEGPVSGGPVRVNDNATAEMDAQTMPAGTQGFTVTLEDADIEPDVPRGVMVLLGEEKISL